MARALQVSPSKIQFSCPTCALANIKTRPVPQGPHESRATAPRQAATLDVVGPFQSSFIHGYKHALVIRDLVSGIAQCYGLKSLTQVTTALHQWRADWHGFETRRARLYVDGASYFVGGTFKETCTQWGWSLSISPSGAHALHPAESLNGVLLRMARAMLMAAELPSRCWYFAYEYACYIRNRLPSQRSTRSPFEIHYGRSPSLDNLHIFGCDVVFKDQAPPNKLAPRGLSGKFLGVARHHNHSTYLILNNRTTHLITTRDVRFFENSIVDRVMNSFPRFTNNQNTVEQGGPKPMGGHLRSDSRKDSSLRFKSFYFPTMCDLN